MDESWNQIGLPYHGAERVPATVLASESRLSVDRCNKFVIVLFYQDVKKGQSLIAFLCILFLFRQLCLYISDSLHLFHSISDGFPWKVSDKKLREWILYFLQFLNSVPRITSSNIFSLKRISHKTFCDSWNWKSEFFDTILHELSNELLLLKHAHIA